MSIEKQQIVENLIQSSIGAIFGILGFLVGLFYKSIESRFKNKKLKSKIIIKLNADNEYNKRMLEKGGRFGYIGKRGIKLQTKNIEVVLNNSNLFKDDFIKISSDLYSRIIEMNYKWDIEKPDGAERFGKFIGEYEGVKKYIEKMIKEIELRIDKKEY